MWYEVIPPMAIIVVAISTPQVFGYYINKIAFNGSPYRRSAENRAELREGFRDRRLTGNALIHNGLDHIPDE